MDTASKNRGLGKALPPVAAIEDLPKTPPPVLLEFTTPAAITKAELREVAALYGATNRKERDGFAPGEILLDTFIGAMDPDSGKYTGEYRFSVLSGAVDSDFSFDELPGLLG